VERRLDLLCGVPVLSLLPKASLRSLAERAQETSFAPGAAVVNEGDAGDRAFLIVEGAAEVTAAGSDGPILLSTLSAGEMFGALALLGSDKRLASVTAMAPLRVLEISGEHFKQLINKAPQARSQFDSAARLMMTNRFLKLAASPFAALPTEQFKELAARLQPRSVPANTVIVRQGDEGDSCFIIRSGEVEVVLQADGQERPIATLGPGALVGEAALLTAAPRNTTVRSLEPCELLVLQRKDLVEVMGKDPGVGRQMRELLQMRSRPRQIPNVVAAENRSLAGEVITILKDPARNVYYRLSPEGWFLWQRLDGRHSLKDLTLAYMKEFKAFAPQAVCEIVMGLSRAGFVQNPEIRQDVVVAVEQPSGWQRWVAVSRSFLEFQVVLRNVDKPLERLYNGGIRLLFTRPAQILLAVISIAGLVAFIASSSRTGAAVRELGPKLLLFLIPAQIISLIIHEGGHAFTTKAIGREVQGVGLGWYWFSTVAFVDTSDTWLATRWERIKVSLAGPYAELVLGSISALIGFFSPSVIVQAALWQFALVSYLSVILNLNPLLEYDGYYILTDALDRPNLRKQTLGWLGNELIPNLGNRRVLKEHLFDVLFGVGSILYVIAMAALTVFLYRVYLQAWLAKWIPDWLSSGLAWLLAGCVVVFSAVNVLGDMKKKSA
jgi:putative peptide zinc metalloprotease protein